MDRLVNFHTHTLLCKHAGGMPADYCEAALQAGISCLGFSDHAPHPDGRWSHVRMDLDLLPYYISSVREAAEVYSGRLEVMAGLECEFVPEFFGYYRDELLGSYGLDYLIGASHWYLMDGEWKGVFSRTEIGDADLHAYADYVSSAIGSGLYAMYAHPDAIWCNYRGWTADTTACVRAICQASVAYHVPLELNANGFRKPKIEDSGVTRAQYPVRRFWEIACEEGVECFVASDAHQPEQVWMRVDDCIELAESCGLRIVNEVLWDMLRDSGASEKRSAGRA